MTSGTMRSSPAITSCARFGRAPRQLRSISSRYFQVISGRAAIIGPESASSIPALVGDRVFVKPAKTAIGGQPGIRRDACTGHEEHPPRMAQAEGDVAIEGHAAMMKRGPWLSPAAA